MFRFPRLATACASLLLVASNSLATKYSFVNIADTRGPFEYLDITQWSVSDTGTVAFIGTQGGLMGVYVGDGASTTNIVPNLAPPPGFPVHLGGINALNASGVAVGTWERDNDFEPFQEWRVRRYEASDAQTIAETTSDGAYTRFVAGDDVNEDGVVAIRQSTYATGSGDGYELSITRWFNGTSTTVLDAAEGFVDVRSVRLNEHGDVAFEGTKRGDEGVSYYRTDGTTLTRIAGPYLTDGTAKLAFNDSGAVAFVEGSGPGPRDEAIYVGDGGPLTMVAAANSTTPFEVIWDYIDMNNQGTVAFSANLWDGRRGIFTGPDPVNDKVIGSGDLLFGRHVSSLTARPIINNRGDVAFWFAVTDPLHPEGEWDGIALAIKQPPLAGDFNNDGRVDAADYVIWRKNDGSQTGYDNWRAHFGQTAGGGAGAAIDSPHAAVPEPSTLGLVAMALLAARRSAAAQRSNIRDSICDTSRSTDNEPLIKRKKRPLRSRQQK